MYLTFKKEDKCLREFLLGDEIYGAIGVANPHETGNLDYYVLVKLPGENGIVNVYGKYIIFGKDDKSEYNFSNLDYILSINKEEKYVIMGSNWGMNIEFELSGLVGYKFVTPKDLVIEMKEKYQNKFKELLTLELPKIRSTEAYKSEYKKQVKENERYYRSDIRIRYLKNSEEVMDYTIKFFNRGYYSYGGYEGEYLNMEVLNLDVLHWYLLTPNGIEDLATNNFQYDYDIENIAKVDLFNTLKEEIHSNPDEEMILSRKIREAIKDAGKTLNVKVKGSDSYEKVKNDFFYGESFRTVTGYRSIYIKDIEEIKFGKNILYKAE